MHLIKRTYLCFVRLVFFVLFMFTDSFLYELKLQTIVSSLIIIIIIIVFFIWWSRPQITGGAREQPVYDERKVQLDISGVRISGGHQFFQFCLLCNNSFTSCQQTQPAFFSALRGRLVRIGPASRLPLTSYHKSQNIMLSVFKYAKFGGLRQILKWIVSQVFHHHNNYYYYYWLDLKPLIQRFLSCHSWRILQLISNSGIKFLNVPPRLNWEGFEHQEHI